MRKSLDPNLRVVEQFRHFYATPPKFNSSPLKNNGWKMSFLLGASLFLGAMLKFEGCMFFFGKTSKLPFFGGLLLKMHLGGVF